MVQGNSDSDDSGLPDTIRIVLVLYLAEHELLTLFYYLEVIKDTPSRSAGVGDVPRGQSKGESILRHSHQYMEAQ